MRDIHCHILPGVDDGAQTLKESLAMLEAAKEVGITSIVCTPHCRDPFFDYQAMWRSFKLLRSHAQGFPLTMGFEVNHAKLMELGMDWADRLCFDGSKEFLLELSRRADKSVYSEYERTIYELQGKGYEVIIAHPEQYRAIQDDVDVARSLVRLGCKLQVSSNYVIDNMFGTIRRTAKRLFDENLVGCIASDAHGVKYYGYMNQVLKHQRKRGNNVCLQGEFRRF